MKRIISAEEELFNLVVYNNNESWLSDLFKDNCYRFNRLKTSIN